jgi:adenylyltransferase/sulfurtransferase
MGVLPPPGSSPTCDTEGVVAPVTAIVGSLEAGLALRILSGGLVPEEARLTTVDVWTGRFQSIAIPVDEACPLCSEGRTDYLSAEPLRTVTLCGRNAVQLIPETAASLDLAILGKGLVVYGPVEQNEFLLRCSSPPYELTLFRDGRAIIRGTEEPSVARSVYSRMVGA